MRLLARLFDCAADRERVLAELAAARFPDVVPVPMVEHLAGLPPIPEPDNGGDEDE
jgi:hypothetical protein